MSGAAECVDWCRGQGAHIISGSFGGLGFSQTLYNAIRDSGALFVAAAGNYGQNLDVEPLQPAGFNLPNLITVAATDGCGSCSLGRWHCFVLGASCASQCCQTRRRGEGEALAHTNGEPMRLELLLRAARADELTSFSNYSPTKVHLAAPGLSIWSTYLDGAYTTMSGTSMVGACPECT